MNFLRYTNKTSLAYHLLLVSIFFCGCFTACTSSAEFEGEKLIRRFFSLMTEGDFKNAANMLYEAPPGMQGPGFSRTDFDSSFAAGAKINYTILSIIPGDEVEAQYFFAPDKQKYFFPDEVPDICQTYLIKLQLDFLDLPEPNIYSIGFIQKVSLFRQEGDWKIGYFTFPSADACYQHRESVVQTRETGISESDGMIPQIIYPQEQIAIIDQTPKDTVLSYYLLLNSQQVGQASILLAADSPARQQMLLNIDQFSVDGQLVSPVIEISAPVSCTNQELPLSEDCQELSVTRQMFYEGGFWASPNGHVTRFTIQLIKEDDHWRIWDIKHNV